jgi:hypothetical protein
MYGIGYQEGFHLASSARFEISNTIVNKADQETGGRNDDSIDTISSVSRQRTLTPF